MIEKTTKKGKFVKDRLKGYIQRRSVSMGVWSIEKNLIEVTLVKI